MHMILAGVVLLIVLTLTTGKTREQRWRELNLSDARMRFYRGAYRFLLWIAIIIVILITFAHFFADPKNHWLHPSHSFSEIFAGNEQVADTCAMPGVECKDDLEVIHKKPVPTSSPRSNQVSCTSSGYAEVDCAQRVARAADQRMLFILHDLLSREDQSGKVKLKNDQALWVEYRDSTCAEAGSKVGSPGVGSEYEVAYQECIARETNSRINELQH